MPPRRRRPGEIFRRPGHSMICLPDGHYIDVYTDDDGTLVTGGSEGRPPRPVQEIVADIQRRQAAAEDAARRDAARLLHHPQRRPQPRRPSDAASTTQPPPPPSPPLQSTPVHSTIRCIHHSPPPPLHRQLQPPQPVPIPYAPGMPRPNFTLTDVDAIRRRVADASKEFAHSDYPDGDGELFTDVDEISQRVADVRMEVTCSDIQTRPYDRPQPPQCELLETPLLEPKNTNTSSPSTQPEALTHDILPVSRQSSLPIFARNPSGWHLQFFIRIDVEGSFHTYPSLGGPFQSLQEAENAITSHLDELRSPMMCTDGLSDAEIGILHDLYWPDGTRKNSSKGKADRRNMSLLVQALLDKYNEDHHLLGDFAYELDDVVIFREFFEGEFFKGEKVMRFYHINLATKTKGEDGLHSSINNLFFAEVRQIEGENKKYVYELSCLCMVKPTDNGQCYGCLSYGNVDLKHPVDTDKYKGGHTAPRSPCCGFDLRCDVIPGLPVPVPAYIEDEEARLVEEEAMLRRYIYKCPAPAKLDGARVRAGLAKREDAGLTKGEYVQGSAKYIVPARRRLLV